MDMTPWILLVSGFALFALIAFEIDRKDRR